MMIFYPTVFTSSSTSSIDTCIAPDSISPRIFSESQSHGGGEEYVQRC
jgi:hypothetical protein